MGRELEWSSLRNIATNLLDGNPIAIIVTAIIAFGFPLVLHYLLYRKVASPPSTSFILLGPSGAGKTALLSLVRLPCEIFEFSTSPSLRIRKRSHTLLRDPTARVEIFSPCATGAAYSYFSDVYLYYRLSSSDCTNRLEPLSLRQRPLSSGS